MLRVVSSSRKAISVFLIACLVFSQFGAVSTVLADDKTDGVTPFNPDRFYPQYESVSAQMSADGSAGVHEFTGAATYSLDFDLPKGRQLQPALSLSYNSQSQNNHNLVGYGWELSEGSITRSSKKGVNTLYTENEFQFSLFGTTQTLVSDSGSQYGLYVPKRNEDFWRYEYKNDDSWLVTDTSGTKYSFSASSDFHQADPLDSSRIYKWMISEIRDTNDNTITFEYLKEHGNIYPKKINYTGHGSSAGNKDIRFVLDSGRMDAAINYAAGFRTFNPYRLSKIQVEVDGVKVQEYSLAYTTGDNNYRSLLSQVLKTGFDGGASESIVLAEFDYHDSGTVGWEEASFSPPTAFISTRRPRYLDRGLRMLDINGDALVDFVSGENMNAEMSMNYDKYDCSENIKGTAYIHNRSLVASGEYGFMSQGFESFPEIFVYGTDSMPTSTTMVDMNGDMYPDILSECYYKDPDTQIDGYSIGIYSHDGSDNWGAKEENMDLLGFDGYRLRTSAYFVDVNGDGLADYMAGEETEDSSNPDYRDISSTVALNTGANTFSEVSYGAPGGSIFNKFSTKDRVDAGVRLVDFNGDGLVDVMRQYDIDGSSPAGLYLNTGSGWEYEAFADFDDPQSVNLRNGFVGKRENPDGSYTYYDSGRRYADVNGDGLADVVTAVQNESGVSSSLELGTGAWGFKVKNNAHMQAYGLPVGVVTGYGFDMGTRLVDVNGDTLPDVVQEFDTDENYGSTANNRKLYLNTGQPGVDLLKTVTNSYGGTSSFEFSASTQYHKSSGGLQNPKLPIKVLTVSKLEHDDGIQSPYSTTYEYQDGHYYYEDAFDREFAGFGEVKKVDNLGHTVRNYFHQSENSIDKSAFGEYEDHISKKGRVFRTDIYDASQGYLKKSYYKWNKTPVGSRYHVYLEHSVEETYDGSSSHKDSAVQYEYDGHGNVVKQTALGEVSSDSVGGFSDTGSDIVVQEVAYALNSDKHIVSLPKEKKLLDGGTVLRKTQYFYDDAALGTVTKGNLSKTTHFNGVETLDTEVDYDSYGNPITYRDPLGNSSSLEYDGHHTLPIKITNAKLHETTMSYNALGKVTAVTNPNTITSHFEYDALGRLTAVKVPDPMNAMSLTTVQKRSYDFASQPVSVSQLIYNEAHPGSFQKDVSFFDGFGRNVQIRRERDSSSAVVIDNFYGSNGKVSKKHFPYFGSGLNYVTPGTKPGKSFEYDALDRVTKQTTDVGITTTSYDRWKTTTINPNSQKVESVVDAFGRMVERNAYLDGRQLMTAYDYDKLGSLMTITDALGNKREFSYDELGRRLSSSEWFRPGATEKKYWYYSYDKNGNVVHRKDPKGQETTVVYDSLNRVTSKKHKDCEACSEDTTSFAYDSGSYAKGKVSSVTTPDVSNTYSYDALGRVVSNTQSMEGMSFDTEQEFDVLGRLVSSTYPDDAVVRHNYDHSGLLKSVVLEENGETTEVVKDITYSPLNQMELLVYGNDLSSVNTYDPTKLYRLVEKETLKGTGAIPVQSLTYAYDAVGNITGITDAMQSETTSFDYDDLNRLTQSEVLSSDLTPYTRTYAYDDIGNITSKSNVGSYSYAHDNPQIVTTAGSTSYSYDDNGNRLDDGTIDYTWNNQNQLERTFKNEQTIDYTYDHTGKRVVKDNTSAGEKTLYVGELYEDQADRTLKYIFAGNQRIATVTRMKGASGTGSTVATEQITNLTVSGGTDPEITVDGVETGYDNDSGFGYTDIAASESFTVDLKDEYPLSSLDLLLNDASFKTYNYTVEGSLDNAVWTTLVDVSGDKVNGLQSHSFTDTDVRYLKITGTDVTDTEPPPPPPPIEYETVETQIFHDGFESGLGDWQSSTTTQIVSDAYAGSQALKTTQTPGTSQVMKNIGTLSNGKTYKFRVKYKAPVGKYGKIYFGGYPANFFKLNYAPGNGSWLTLEVSHTMTQDDAGYIKLASNGWLSPYGNTVTYDEVEVLEVTQVPLPPPPPPPPDTKFEIVELKVFAEKPTLGVEGVTYHHPDHLGSASLTTDAAGDTVSDLRYYPYGEDRSVEGEHVSAFKFTDQEEDAELGLYYYDARYYDPVIAKFVSNDPLQQNVETMVAAGEDNGYRYVLNNPIKYVDPTGEYFMLTPHPMVDPRSPADLDVNWKTVGWGVFEVVGGVGSIAGGLKLTIESAGLGAMVGGKLAITEGITQAGVGLVNIAHGLSGEDHIPVESPLATTVLPNVGILVDIKKALFELPEETNASSDLTPKNVVNFTKGDETYGPPKPEVYGPPKPEVYDSPKPEVYGPPKPEVYDPPKQNEQFFNRPQLKYAEFQ